MSKHRNAPSVMVSALRHLAESIESDDGIANACCADAAEMIEEAAGIIRSLSQYVTHAPEGQRCIGCEVHGRATRWFAADSPIPRNTSERSPCPPSSP